jgi:hypothetical protein
VRPVESRSVSWWPVHEFLAAVLAQANEAPPMAGTPAWRALADSDPAKLLALAVAGEHHVLRMEIGQEALADASKAIAAVADWPAISREVRQRAEARRSGARIERRIDVA